MGLDLQYKSGQSACSFRFSEADWKTIEKLNDFLPDAVKTCFNVPDFGEATCVSAAALSEAARELDDFLGTNKQLLPATYRRACQYCLTPDHPVPLYYETGGMHGFHLVGDPEYVCSLETGFDECKFERYRASDGQKVEEKDLRGATDVELQTVEWGRVTLKKSAAKTTLRKALREILRFAEKAPLPEITKTLG